MARYTFTHYAQAEAPAPFPECTESRKVVEFNNDWEQWSVVLEEFCTFLSGIYGYDIKKQVLVKRINFETGKTEDVPLGEATEQWL